MTEIMQNELNAYYKQVDNLLLCDRKSKKAFMTELKNDIDEFVRQETNSDFNSILTTFGTPEEIAESFLKNSDIVSIKKKMNVKKMVLFSLLAIVLVYVIFVIASFIDVHTEAHGFFEEGILHAGILSAGRLGL